MALFRRSKSSRSASSEDLDAFLASRTGVEGYVEPATQFAPTTLLLVAHDGESIRRQVKSGQWAQSYCRKKHVPCYNATLVGYPQKMREYNQRRNGQRDTASPPAQSAKRSPAQRNAIMTLEVIAGSEPLGDNPTSTELQQLIKVARARSHPDRHGGDRSRWDQVESAARALDLL